MDTLKNLFGSDGKGYITTSKIKNNKIENISANSSNLAEVLESHKGDTDVYMTRNTTYIQQRQVKNIRHLNYLYSDIDLSTYDKQEAIYHIWDLVLKDIIPEPTEVNDSGRGLHVYWRIEDAPYAALPTWQNLQDYLYQKLKHIGADPKATDAVRLLRIVGTINSKTGTECVNLIKNDNIYSMVDLREKYLNYKPAVTKEKKAATKSKVITNKLFNAYSLHTTRLSDLIKIVELRNGDMKGCRNMAVHCFAYWCGIYERDTEVLTERVHEFNNSFKEPLKDVEVRAILRCIPKAIKSYLDYTIDGIKPTKGNREKGGYWYKNETLIERLEITPHEMEKLETIIDTSTKYQRNNKRRYDSIRNDEGLTNKQQELKELKEQAEALRVAGYSMQKIADELNVSKAKIVRLINK